MLISLILIGILVLFSLGVSNLVVNSIRESANVNQANQAYYAAEGGLEKGLLENAVQGTAGYSKDAWVENLNCKQGQQCVPGTPGVIASTVKIQGKSPANFRIPPDSGEFVIPTPGTGTAGKGCDPLNPNLDADVAGKVPTGGLDDACNWNKIKVGETVGIPLYATDPDDHTKILNPVDLKLESLKIKIRTPCEEKPGSTIDEHLNCASLVRYSFNDMTDGDPVLRCIPTKTYGCGDTIVSWQIIGSNITGDKVYTLGPIDDLKLPAKIYRTKSNSEIYEWLIDNAKATGIVNALSFLCGEPSCVLFVDNIYPPTSSSGREVTTLNSGSIFAFLTNDAKDTGFFSRTPSDAIYKPVLKLSVVNSLNSSLDDPIPYLEYQVTSNVSVGGAPLADSAQTITSEGFSGPFKQVLEVRQPQETGLLEYVIQQ